jgi:hypothetical protein
MKRVKPKQKKLPTGKFCDPGFCNFCTYIGEGDFICDKYNEIVVSDWEPTEDFLMCTNKHTAQKA